MALLSGQIMVFCSIINIFQRFTVCR
jgi:hypothetical protein